MLARDRQLAGGTRCARVTGDAVANEIRVIRLGIGNPCCGRMAVFAILANKWRMCCRAHWARGLAGVMARRTSLAGNHAIIVVHQRREETRRRMACFAKIRCRDMRAHSTQNRSTGLVLRIGNWSGTVAGHARRRRNFRIRMAEGCRNPSRRCVAVFAGVAGQQMAAWRSCFAFGRSVRTIVTREACAAGLRMIKRRSRGHPDIYIVAIGAVVGGLEVGSKILTRDRLRGRRMCSIMA